MKERLDALVEKYNVPEFAASDPVGFPRGYGLREDIEIVSLLVSTIAWGNRKMILRDADRMLGLLEYEPYLFVQQGDIEAVADDNIHRTFFGRHLRYYLRGLRLLYSRYGSLEGMAAALGAQNSEAPAWVIADGLRRTLLEANADHPAEECSRCLPANIDGSALKRLNMALRWLVRNDGIVDIGCWSLLRPDQLYIPLDVHSGGTARALGLLTRKSNDRKAVEELTANLRRLNPADPTIYDFALFGAGIAGELPRE